jgi:hypothetical protein
MTPPNVKKAMYIPILLFIISTTLAFIFILISDSISSKIWSNFFLKLSDASSFISAGTASAMALVFVLELTKNQI